MSQSNPKAQMEPEQIYQHLENLAEQLGVSIRYADLADPEVPASSGLCKVKGRYLYIMDTSKSLPERIRLLSESLSCMNLEGVFVLPTIRNLLEASGRANESKGATARG